jgi:hypothetical protein
MEGSAAASEDAARLGFKDRVVAVGREATLQKQLQEVCRAHQVRARENTRTGTLLH